MAGLPPEAAVGIISSRGAADDPKRTSLMLANIQNMERSYAFGDKGLCDEIHCISCGRSTPDRVNGDLGFGHPISAGDGQLPLFANAFRDYCPGLSCICHAA